MSKTFRSRSSDHVPVVPTMVSTGTVGVKRIHVFRNADVFFQGIQVVVNTHRVPSMDVLLDVISERIGLVNGAKKLYSTGGVLIKDINKIRDGQSYVASSSHFTPMNYGGQTHQKEHTSKKKKKKVRSKTVHSVERKKHEEVESEVVIPWNEEHLEKEKEREKEHEKNKKKKKVVKKKKKGKEEHHGSNETLAETAEVELPSEIEDSEVEEHREHHHHHDHEDDTHSRGRSTLQSPEPSRPSTAFRHNTDPPRSTSRRGSRKDIPEKEDKKEGKKSTRRKSQPNWGDLSNFTKNIESLLKN